MSIKTGWHVTWDGGDKGVAVSEIFGEEDDALVKIVFSRPLREGEEVNNINGPNFTCQIEVDKKHNQVHTSIIISKEIAENLHTLLGRSLIGLSPNPIQYKKVD